MGNPKDYFAAWMLFLLKLWHAVEDLQHVDHSLFEYFLPLEKTTSEQNQKIFNFITNVLTRPQDKKRRR